MLSLPFLLALVVGLHRADSLTRDSSTKGITPLQQTVHNFSYSNQDQWGTQWPLCSSGERQSPVEISPLANYSSTGLELSFDDSARFLSIKPNGSMRIEYGYGRLAVRSSPSQESSYQSVSMVLKSPGQHSIGGQRGALELEVRFRKIDGSGNSLAIMAVRIMSNASAQVDFLMDQLKIAEGSLHQPKEVNFAQVLRPIKNGRFFVYSGSLTQPPCSEIVTWVVAQKVLAVRPTTLQILTATINQGTPNNRLTQPLRSQNIQVATVSE